MVDLPHHPPAMKVGGRRLSVSSRPRSHAASSLNSSPGNANQTDSADYPRPAPPGEEHVEHAHHHDEVPPHTEEEVPKKEKKHGHNNHENDNRIKESAYNKVGATRPTKDYGGAKNTFGAGGRIAQPAGKSFGS